MSIHELEFGESVTPIRTRCLDTEIFLARHQLYEKKRLLHEIPVKPFHPPTLMERRLLNKREDGLPPYEIVKTAVLIRIISAISLEEVAESILVSGFDSNGESHNIYVDFRTYIKDKINEADLQIRNKRFAYTETPLYVAPTITRRP